MDGRRLHGQVALVTGGGRGIGLAIGTALASAGAGVALAARSGDELAQAVEAIAAEGGVARGWVLDVTDPGAVTGVVEDVEEELGPVTLLVNNAGTAHLPGPLWEVDPDGWWRDLEVHVRGAFNCCRAVVGRMVERRRGRVVNIGSLAGAQDEAYVSGYACAKAAYFRLTGSLAAETAEHGVTVFCVSPGLVRTRMVEELVGDAGRRWRPWIAGASPEDYTPAERVAGLLVRIAAGDADPLSGRFLHARDNLDELLADASRITADDLLTLRLREWPGDRPQAVPGVGTAG
jgi:NAD(P)-dependent dehydrogenase (short-subunit alcohol dehydrogenase family)